MSKDKPTAKYVGTPGIYNPKPLKTRQGEHTITLRKPPAIFSVPSRDCWHEGIWLCFRVKKCDGNYIGHKVPPWRVVGVTWNEEVERTEDA